jgi:ATP-dependent DNA ligase
MPRRASSKKADIEAGFLPAERLQQSFPQLHLPIKPPYPPMEAKLVDDIPSGDGWQYEPKWDGFRCLAFRDRNTVALQSKAGQPLGRYFPELVEAVASLPLDKFVLDGEIVIPVGKHLSFDDLLMRIHPAASRIRKLSAETPALFLAFDLLLDEQGLLTSLPLHARRERLEKFFKKLKGHKSLRLSPFTTEYEEANGWMSKSWAADMDGVIAKRLDQSYESGERAMRKVKRMRTVDCVVGGFRYASKGGQVGSLLLGLYNDQGQLDHVGFSSSFSAEERKKLAAILKPYMNGEGFTGKAPGGPSRWSTERSGEWERLDPKLVCEVRYDHFSGGRFRHGTKFLRWRPEKKPKTCTMDQVERKGSVNRLLVA